jgi:hypothetical protein
MRAMQFAERRGSEGPNGMLMSGLLQSGPTPVGKACGSQTGTGSERPGIPSCSRRSSSTPRRGSSPWRDGWTRRAGVRLASCRLPRTCPAAVAVRQRDDRAELVDSGRATRAEPRRCLVGDRGSGTHQPLRMWLAVDTELWSRPTFGFGRVADAGRASRGSKAGPFRCRQGRRLASLRGRWRCCVEMRRRRSITSQQSECAGTGWPRSRTSNDSWRRRC